MTGDTSCQFCEFIGSYDALWRHKTETHINRIRFPAPSSPPKMINRTAHDMIQIFKCDFCHELPPINSPIIGCQIGHIFCVNDHPKKGLCIIQNCNARCDSRQIKVEEALAYALKIDDYTCNIQNCQYRNGLYIMISHMKYCSHPITRSNTISLYTNKTNSMQKHNI